MTSKPQILREIRIPWTGEGDPRSSIIVRSYLCGDCEDVHVHLDITRSTFRAELNLTDKEARLLESAIDELLNA